jgi:hypothetical protein
MVCFLAGLTRVGSGFGAFETNGCLHSAISRYLAFLGVRRALGLDTRGCCCFGPLEANRLLDPVTVGMLRRGLSASVHCSQAEEYCNFRYAVHNRLPTLLSCSLFAKPTQIVDLAARAKWCTRLAKKLPGEKLPGRPYLGSRL